MGKVTKNLKEISRLNFTSSKDEFQAWGNETIQTSCMMRIADASELMAKNFLNIQDDLERYKRMYHRERSDNDSLRRSVSSYKGKFNSLKKKIDNAKEQCSTTPPNPST